MDLRYSEADEAFRRELRAWLAREVPRHGAPPAGTTGRRAAPTTPTGSAGSSTPATPA